MVCVETQSDGSIPILRNQMLSKQTINWIFYGKSAWWHCLWSSAGQF